MLVWVYVVGVFARSNQQDSHPHHHHHHHHQFEWVSQAPTNETPTEKDDQASPAASLSHAHPTVDLGKSEPVASVTPANHNASLLRLQAVSPHEEAEGILAHVKSDVNGEIWVKEDVAIGLHMETWAERSMYFQAAMGAQSVVKCLQSAAAAAAAESAVCCPSDTKVPCCHADHTFVPDGFLGVSLLALPMFEATWNGTRSAKHVLVVGLGGGNLPSYIRRNFNAVEVTVVEIDPVVLECARAYFGFCEDAKTRVVIQAIEAFVASQSSERWDVIFLDAFIKNEMPKSLLGSSFMGALRSKLNNRGILVANVFSVSPGKIKSACGMIRKIFPEFTVLNQMPLEMSVVSFSANVDRREAALFDVNNMIEVVKRLVARKQLPAVLELVATSRHFRNSLSRPLAANASVPISQTIISWH